MIVGSSCSGWYSGRLRRAGLLQDRFSAASMSTPSWSAATTTRPSHPANSRLLRRAFAPPALSRSRPSPPASTRRERPPGSNPCSGTPRSPPRASKDTYLAARHRRIMARRGRNRALVAVQHSILIAVWHICHQRHGLLRPRCELHHRTRRQGARHQTPHRAAQPPRPSGHAQPVWRSHEWLAYNATHHDFRISDRVITGRRAANRFEPSPA